MVQPCLIPPCLHPASGVAAELIKAADDDGITKGNFQSIKTSTIRISRIVASHAWLREFAAAAHAAGRSVNNDWSGYQVLKSDSASVTWLRGGSSPEVGRTTFEYSANGLDWMALGDGVRISGGWQLTGLAIPAGAAVRARGFVPGAGKAGYLVESTTGGAPALSITLNAALSTVTVSWPAPSEGWLLERTNVLTDMAGLWAQVPPPYQTNGGTLSVTVTNTPADNRFFRLQKPLAGSVHASPVPP